MKAILEFDLDNFEDRKAHKRAISATDAYLVFIDFNDYFRSKMKYSELSEEEFNVLQSAKDKFYELIMERKIDLDDLE